MPAILTNVEPRMDAAGNPSIGFDVLIYGGANGIVTQMSVPILAADTAVAVNNRILAAIDAEAIRIGAPAQAAIIGPSYARLR